MNPAFTLDSTYIHLRPDESALAMEGGAGSGRASRSATTSRRPPDGSTDQSKDWDHWEPPSRRRRDPDPAVGEMIIVLNRRRRAAGQDQARRDLHRTQGLRHRGIVKAPGRLMFVTPGPGPSKLRARGSLRNRRGRRPALQT